MRALQTLLVILFSALVLTACGEPTLGPLPAPDDQTEPSDKDDGNDDGAGFEEGPGPSILWQESFGSHQWTRHTRMAVTDNGTVFLAASEYVKPGDQTQVADYLYIFTADGQQAGKHLLSVEGRQGHVSGIVPASSDSVLVFGVTQDKRAGVEHRVTYVHRFDSRGNRLWKEPLFITNTEMELIAGGGVSGPDGSAFIYGQASGRSDAESWAALVNPEADGDLEWLTYYPFTHVQIDAAYVTSSSAPDEAQDGVYVVLRKKHEKADCETMPHLDPCYPHNDRPVLFHYFDVVDAATGRYLADLTPQLEPTQLYDFASIDADTIGNVYLAGAYTTPDKDAFGTANLVLLKYNLRDETSSPPLLDGSPFHETVRHISVTDTGNVIVVGESLGNSAVKEGRWTNQKGKGPVFIAEYTPDLKRTWVYRVGNADDNWVGRIAVHNSKIGYVLAGGKVASRDGMPGDAPNTTGHFLIGFSNEIE